MLIGTLYLCNGESFDYCYKEAITSMTEFCDAVCVVSCITQDGTQEGVRELAITNSKIDAYYDAKWEGKGNEIYYNCEKIFREKMLPKYLHNKNIWRIAMESDEIIHERSYESIKRLVEKNEHLSYAVSRFNLYRQFHLYKKFDVRKLCGDLIGKLARISETPIPEQEGFERKKLCYKYIDELTLFHYGFMRKGKKLLEKAINFQGQYLGYVDPTVLHQNSIGMYSPVHCEVEDLAVLKIKHPKIMREWIESHKSDNTRSIPPWDDNFKYLLED